MFLDLPNRIKKLIKKTYIIMIVGDMGSGKTTESCILANEIDRSTIVIAQHNHQVDKELHEEFNLDRYVAGSCHIKPILDNKRVLFIIDDYYSANTRQRGNVHRIVNDLRKRHAQIIFVYHGDTIRKDYLTDNSSLLVVKRNAGLGSRKFKQYFNVSGINSVASEYCNKLTGYDTVYILKDGTYYHRHNDSGNITKDKFIPKIQVDIDINRLKKYLLVKQLSQTETAKKLGISLSKIQREISKLKEKDPIFKKSYKNTVKVKVAGGISKKAKNVKFGVSLQIEQEKLKSVAKKNSHNVAKMQNIKDKGDALTQTVGDAIYKIIKKDEPSNQRIEIIIRKARGGSDIEIHINNKIIEIEIKNYKITKDKKYLTLYYIKNKVIKRFKYDNSEKWLMTCGRYPNNYSKKILADHNINYFKLSNKQFLLGDRNKKYKLKKKLETYVTTHIIVPED